MRIKSIWINLFNISNMFHSCSTLHIRQSIERYILQELEYLVIRRARAEDTRKSSPALTRWFPIDNSDVTTLILVEDKRWYCVWYGIGLVLWFRSPTASENSFNTWPIPCTHGSGYLQQIHFSLIRSCVVFIKKWCVLFILLEYESWYYIHDPAYRTTRNQMVQITTLPLNQNDGASFSAVLLFSFNREDCGTLWSTPILGRFIAFGVATPGGMGLSCYVAKVDSQSISSRIIIISKDDHLL